jgi:hypothetical protein
MVAHPRHVRHQQPVERSHAPAYAQLLFWRRAVFLLQKGQSDQLVADIAGFIKEEPQ